jgi:monoamine oxidase
MNLRSHFGGRVVRVSVWSVCPCGPCVRVVRVSVWSSDSGPNTLITMPPFHVVIVGGGVSGCAAADRLAALLPPSAVALTLLESAERLGGRTLSTPLASRPGASVDLGGQWIGERQDAALQLVRELGLTLHPQHHAGRRVLALAGDAVKTYTGLIPNASWAVLLDAQATLALLALLRFCLWLAPASALARWADGVSVAQLSARVMWTAGAAALVRIVVQGLFGCEPEDLSLAAFCRYVNASGGVEPMTEIGPGTLQCWTVVGGTQQLSSGLLARAGGARVATRLGHRVLSIRRGPAGLTLQCENGAELACDFCILALPPPLAGRIAFHPPLDPQRCALMAGARMGGIIKSIAVYESAFWRQEGFSGEAIAETSQAAGPVFNTFDNCVPAAAAAAAAAAARAVPTRAAPSGAAAGISITDLSLSAPDAVPALVVFINGARAVEWSARPAEERKEVVLQQLAGWFGPRALMPVEYVEKDWVSDPHTRGCPIASYPAALLSEYGLQRQLAEPCWPMEGSAGAGAGAPGSSSGSSASSSASSASAGESLGAAHRLHWAGTECAETGTGFIDGALRAGQAAAEGVARAITALRQGGAAAAAAAAGAGGGGGGGGGGGVAPLIPAAPAQLLQRQQQQQRQQGGMAAAGGDSSRTEQLASLL